MKTTISTKHAGSSIRLSVYEDMEMDVSGAMSSTDIFVLVLFTDGIYLICNTSEVSAYKKKCPAVKFTDGKKYSARILALHEDRIVLQNIQKCLEEECNTVFFESIFRTNEELTYFDIVEKHKNRRDASKLYLDTAILPSRGDNSTDWVFSVPDQEIKNFFKIQMKLFEHNMTRCESHERSRTIEQHDVSVETVTIEHIPEHLSNHAPNEIFRETYPPPVSVDPISELPSELVTIENADKYHILDEEDTRIEQNANVQILDVEHLPEMIITDVNETRKHEAKMLNENVQMEIPNPEIDDVQMTANQHMKTKVIETNGFQESSAQTLFAQRVPQSQTTPPIEKIVEEEIEKSVEDKHVIKNANLIDENCNFPAASVLNENLHGIYHNQSNTDEAGQKDLQGFLKELGLTTTMTEDLCDAYAKNPIYEDIFDSDGEERRDHAEIFKGGNADTSACNFTQDPNPKPKASANSFPPDSSNSSKVNSCEGKPIVIRESRLKPTIRLNSVFTQKVTVIKGEIQNSVPHDMSIIPTPVGNSTLLERADDFSDFVGPEKEDDEFSVSSNDGKNSASHDESDDYIPSPVESSDSDGDCDTKIKAVDTTKTRKIHDVSSSPLNITFGLNKPGMSAPDDTELAVTSSEMPAHTKKNFCLYCQKFQSKIARHLELVHACEKDVKEFASLPPNNKERMQLIAIIRKKGNHLYNSDRRFNRGELLVVRRPQKRMNKCAKDYQVCGNCDGQYSRSVIRHHFKRCTKKSSGKERLVMVKGRKVAGRIHEKANELVRAHIFPYMREDDVVRGIRYDKLMILYANKQCDKYGAHQHHYSMIRGRLRLLGRFLMTMKKRNIAIKEFADVFQPRHYDDCVAAVKIVAGFDETSRMFRHPAVASNLGTLLKYAGQIQRSEYIKGERVTEQKRVEDFLNLQVEDYGTSVNRAVMETQSQNNRRKKVVLPNLDDITKLHNFLNAEQQKYFGSLNNKFSVDAWRKLAEVTLIMLQLFNRRRAGEIERVYIEDFNSYQGIDQVADRETYASLSRHGQALAKKYVRFMIRGKKGRGVPVLVPANLLDALILICKYRSNAGVPETNPYLFGVPSKDQDRLKYLRACDLLRQFAEQCGADVPDRLRGTQLRKHVATKCVSLNLSENEVSDLANFLGHADKIHREIYRQPDVQKDIIKISQLLEMAQGTNDLVPDAEDSSSEEEQDPRPPTIVAAENRSESEFGEYSSRKSISGGPSGHRHRFWTPEERDTVLGAFENMMHEGKMPTGQQIQTLIRENACLQGREIAQLRTWLHTQKKKYVKISF